MKQLFSLAALAALLSATGCTQQEVFTGDGGEDEPAVLGISTGVLSAETKSVVGGEMITYTKANYSADALGIGVVILNSEGTAAYSGGEISADHVWFMGDERGEKWKSISVKGGSFDAATAAPYTLKDEVGTVYAYYPKADNVTGTTADALTILALLQKTGTITLSDDVTNADLRFDSDKKNWVSNTLNKGKIISAPTEVDYLYANNVDRKVSNGRVASSPGRSIDLTMAHALTMVSFRLYNDGTLSGAGNLTQIKIKNADAKTLIKTTTGATMKLKDGTITNLSANNSDNLTRTISGYTIPKQITEGEQSATTYIVNATVTGPKVARKVSFLTYPLTSISENDIEVVFTIDGKEYTVSLPVTVADAWEAGINYIYTVCASQRKLEVTSVSVQKWEETSGGNIDL
ncbi:fimbrillin family protein [Parabacteroides sp.]|uniref:fimbrillin family protein n=1 Tax=Parabacteroides sp. TaxID=1869337 RepID=UPI00308017A2